MFSTLFISNLFLLVKAEILSDILKDFQNKSGLGQTALSILIIILGIYLIIFGTRFQKINLTILSSISMTQLIRTITQTLSDKNYKFLGIISIPELIREKINILEKMMEKDLWIYLIVILILSLVLSWILISFINMITAVVILILIGLCWSEGYHDKFLNYLGIDHIYVKYFLLIILFGILLYFYFKIPRLILAIIFSLVGSGMFTYGIDTLFNLGWKSLEFFSSTIANKRIDWSEKGMFVWMLTFAFGLGIQFLGIFTGK